MKLYQVDTESRVLHVARLKGGLWTTQPPRGDELRAVSAWLKERARMKPTGKAFFVSEQRKPCTARPLTCSCENTAPPLPCLCSSIPTCCATLAASPWPIKAQILGSFRITSDTATISTPSSTRPPQRPSPIYIFAYPKIRKSALWRLDSKSAHGCENNLSWASAYS